MVEAKVFLKIFEDRGWVMKGGTPDYSSVFYSRHYVNQQDTDQLWAQIVDGVMSLVKEAGSISMHAGKPSNGYFFHCHLGNPKFLEKLGIALEKA